MKNLVFVLLSLSASAFAAVDQRVYGSWQSAGPLFQTPEMSVSLGMTLRPGSVVASSICTFSDGSSLTASVTVPAEITESEIRVTGTGRNSVAVGGKTCDVGASPNATKYVLVSDSVLSLTDSASGMSFNFNRK
jgi:hypothetical protein